MAERLNPLNDFLFMKYMGEKGDEKQLLSFLNAVLKRTEQNKLTAVEILENKTLTPEIIGDKTSILDIRAVTNDGSKINIEVQVCKFKDMSRRSLFYWSREYVRGIKAGQVYTDLPKVIAINIVDFEFLSEVDFHSIFHIREDTHKECFLTDALEIHFVDMVKWRSIIKKDIEGDPLQRWLAFFDKGTPEKTLKEIINMDKAIQEAQKRITYVSADDETLRAYQMREMGLSDWNSRLFDARQEGLFEGKREGIREGEQKGLKEGLEQGLEKGRQALQTSARKMKALGISLEQIREITGLSPAEIEKL
ncbi:MAG: Rpn family recombination-promoting nuclease/putative transposase [Candidatus Margulisbacteria bacterium]|jgi:predicted transposase/invertase (TIGR01784 family)|nr:Rpn family recombination-promoting nuclease/putative transposase [Candidatus Margulisiibacteriota bacterium]